MTVYDIRPNPGEAGHQQYELLSAGYVLDALEPADAGEFSAHLPHCAACRRTVDDFFATMAQLTDPTAGPQPPAELADRIKRAIRDDPAEPTVDFTAARNYSSGPNIAFAAPESMQRRGRQVKRPRHVRTRWTTQGLAAAAAVAVVAVGGWNVVLQHQLSDSRQVATQQQDLIRSVAEPGSHVTPLAGVNGQPKAVAYVVSGRGGLRVLADGLPATPANAQYVVWATNTAAGTGPRPLAGFTVAGTDPTVRQLSVPSSAVSSADGFAISREPGTALPSAPTTIVAAGNVRH